MTSHTNTTFVLKNEILFHFLRSELLSEEMNAMRVHGKDGLNALAASDRYASAMAFIDSIRADDELTEQEEPESLC
ncbi:MAG: hypothetical protein WCH39_29865 [Schlesneria sp.]